MASGSGFVSTGGPTVERNWVHFRKHGMYFKSLTFQKFQYPKVASSRLSPLVAHPKIFILFMKGNFDAYVL